MQAQPPTLKPKFVFFHVGPDLSMPSMLAQTIRLTNPRAEIIHCTDRVTPAIEGVDWVHRDELDTSRLMTARLQVFSSLGLSEPALYLDTDMLVIKPIDVLGLLEDKRVSFCARSFNFYGPFIGSQRGLDFNEYAGQPLGEVYPYVACSTATQDHTVWGELVLSLQSLDPKFAVWYGDQEAMKVWARTHPNQMKTHPESRFGCLPEEKTHLKEASVLHFKGAARKALMHRVFGAIIPSATLDNRAKEDI